jgi:hypothetical protein
MKKTEVLILDVALNEYFTAVIHCTLSKYSVVTTVILTPKGQWQPKWLFTLLGRLL